VRTEDRVQTRWLHYHWDLHGDEGSVSDPDELRIRDLEARINAVVQQAHALVHELLADDGLLWPVAERLPALGSVILPAIRQLLTDYTVPAETRGFAALVGFIVGDREESSQVLLDEIEQDTGFAVTAARQLAVVGEQQAVWPIEDAIRRSDLKDVHEADKILGYLDDQQKLGHRLPDDLRTRLIASGSQELERAVRELHP
jgi:hypothetical protein